MSECHTDGGPCSGFAVEGTHCESVVPADVNRARVITYEVYPPLDYGNARRVPSNQVTYSGSVLSDTALGIFNTSYTSPNNASALGAATCGKEVKTLSCGLFGSYKVFDNIPDGLSFRWMDSDTWFVYVWESGANGGVINTPCYWLVTEEQTTSTTSTPGTPPPGGGTGETTEESTSGGTTCVPCSAFYCTPSSMSCSYNAETGDETGDPDCPYPTIYGIGTNSRKIVFKYNQLSTELPTGVKSLSFIYAPDSIDVLAYDVDTIGSLDPIETTANPWQSGEELVDSFYIFEGAAVESGTKQGLRVKIGIKPTVDTSTEPVTITGTTFEVQEILDYGQNYQVGDTFNLSYTHSHPDSSTTTFNFSIRVDSVGPVDVLTSIPGFDLLREGDTINGHTITNTFHTDIDNFKYHLVYIDGLGNDFAKDTQYTSDRDHIITVVAGYGIPDRASLIGLYEFTNKSIQYTTLSVDRDSPNIYGEVVDPVITTSVTNGQLSGVTIVDGGSGWNTINQIPEVVVTSPSVSSGKPAKVEATFSAGVMTSIKIIEGGSGYSSSDPPTVWIRNRYKKITEITNTGMTDEEAATIPWIESVKATNTFPEFNDQFNSPDVVTALDALQESYQEKTITYETDNGVMLEDQERNRKLKINQRLFSKGAVDKLRAGFSFEKSDITDNFAGDATKNQEFIDSWSGAQDNTHESIENHLDAITQDQIPEFVTYKEVKVETTQRRFLELPESSTYTKYLITQYRADNRVDTRLTVTLSSTVEENGCEHMYDGDPPDACPPPGLPTAAGSTTTETDPVTGDSSTTTVSYTYSVSGIHGSGCQSWEVSGQMLIYNNLTKAANTFSDSIEAYGNPFDL